MGLGKVLPTRSLNLIELGTCVTFVQDSWRPRDKDIGCGGHDHEEVSEKHDCGGMYLGC